MNYNTETTKPCQNDKLFMLNRLKEPLTGSQFKITPLNFKKY